MATNTANSRRNSESERIAYMDYLIDYHLKTRRINLFEENILSKDVYPKGQQCGC